MNPCEGRVLLVGAGPGAADLLTLRAARAISAADVLLVDALVGREVLDLARADARIIHVGKRGHRPSASQDFINRLMARMARSGATVVRLKGGDPSIFGRAAEERAYLEAKGVAVDVIPGVTTASAAAAQFGFALTRRGDVRRVVFATGRNVQGAELDWANAVDPQSTLCLYMGCADIEAICAALIAAGRAPETPAVAALNVERPGATIRHTTLGQLAAVLTDVSDDVVFIAIGVGCAQRATGNAPLAIQARKKTPHEPSAQGSVVRVRSPKSMRDRPTSR